MIASDDTHANRVDRPRFQFSLRTLLSLTTFCAVLAALSRWLFGQTLFAIIVMVYFGFLGLYAIFRVIYLAGRYFPQLKSIREDRQRLAAEIAKSRADRPGSTQT